MILVSNQYRELNVKTFHHLSRLSMYLWLFRKFNLPMTQESLYLEVQGYKEIHDLFVLSSSNTI